MERMRMVFIFLEPFLIKLPRASSWLEQFTCFKAGLVKSKSTDKRWCIRADCGTVCLPYVQTCDVVPAQDSVVVIQFHPL